jgi:DNA-damage-inducible protein D
MTNEKQMAIFEGQKIRRIWDEKEEKWYFSIVDVVGILSQSIDPQNYWKVFKNRLKKEGSEVVTKCNQLKMQASDGKYYFTDSADTEVILRLIQSVPSPKAEPFKLWLAKVGYERIQEIENPELAAERARAIYRAKGYPEAWIEKRMRGIEVRETLTNEWKNRGAKEKVEFAILTNEIMKGAFDMTAEGYKKFKGLKRENLRDHMEDMELILTMLGEATTTKLHKDRNSKGFPSLKNDAKDGGDVAGRTRKDIEQRSGKPVISKNNFKALDGGKRKKLNSPR